MSKPIICKQCNSELNLKDDSVSTAAFTLAGATARAVGGGKVGITLGPYGTSAATILGAIVGTVVAVVFAVIRRTRGHNDE